MLRLNDKLDSGKASEICLVKKRSERGLALPVQTLKGQSPNKTRETEILSNSTQFLKGEPLVTN